jgi:hypothetical protein
MRPSGASAHNSATLSLRFESRIICDMKGSPEKLCFLSEVLGLIASWLQREYQKQSSIFDLITVVALIFPKLQV